MSCSTSQTIAPVQEPLEPAVAEATMTIRKGRRRRNRRMQPSTCRTVDGSVGPTLAGLLALPAVACLLVSLSVVQTAEAAIETNKLGEIASKLSASGSKLVRNLELSKSSGQLNDWLVHQVAPAMATKIIDNVLQLPAQKGGSTKKSKSLEANERTPIDTQALADKIVDKLADRIRNRKSAGGAVTPDEEPASDKSIQANDDGEQRSSAGALVATPNRKGKSLVGDSMQQVVQNLFGKDNRKLFGRAMEKSRFPLRVGQHQTQYQSHHNSANNHNNSFQLVRESAYEQPMFVSTDSSQLDENPVVLRAEHGHNSSQSAHHQRQQHQQQDGMMQNSLNIQNENLSLVISSLMSSPATNKIGNQLLQNHQKNRQHQQQQQQKYVHSNRHQQHQLAPKPWPSSSSSANGVRRQQQSPYSLPATSDINIVQAPSSPAPPVVALISTTQPTTTSSTSTTTTANPLPPFSFVPLPNQAASQTNKFKINNRHQHPSGSWQNPRNPYYNNHRYQHHYPAGSTSTTSTTTTTTTTTTTPEPPPPQTEPMLTETMESIEDLEHQTSAPVSSILSSVAQSALESLSQAASQHSNQNSQDDYSPSYSNSSYATSTAASSPHSFSSSSSSSSSHSGTKGASPSSTSARHSMLSAESIPTALGAPLYHHTRANFTAVSIMGPPPRRSGTSPAAKAAAQYLQKGLNSLSSTIFGRQNKNWARRLGLSSVLLSGLLYGAAVLSNPGAPLPANGFQVLQALATRKKRRGSKETLLPAIDSGKFAIPAMSGSMNAALMDLNSNNMNILNQQPQLIPLIEQLIQQEQQQQQQQQHNSLFSQRSSLSSSPIEIESFDDDQINRRDSPSQHYTIQAIPRFLTELSGGDLQNQMIKQTPTTRR